ncbi:MAG: CCA tRNA nucleotidyltransferase [Haloferacaceae archaeon]
MTELSDVVAAVDRRVRPDEGERERLDAAVDELVARTEAAAADLPVETDVLQVGSTARGTWLSGDRDIDLFVRFPPSLDRERLERYGLQVGHAVLPDGREEYAEHPYVTGTIDGFDVDLVPCYDVADASEASSAVDRTPFHTAYLEGRIDELAGDVRVLKQLLTAVGAYGSNLRTRGFSGYLTELLVLEHGGVVPLVEAAADWQPPVRYDPEGHGTTTFDDPLVVVDPTDPERNVAAVCVAENVARFQHYARDLLVDPREEPFFREPQTPLDAPAVREHVERRATTPVAVVFDAPDIVADQLYPQLRRSLDGVTSALDRRGFEPVRTATFADERAVLFVELAVDRLPAVERHEGPPVAAREHATNFFEAYVDDPDTYGPFLDGPRYVVERPRAFQRPAAFLRSDAVHDVALGARVADALREGYEVLVGTEVTDLADEFGRPLARHFEPTP